MAKYSQTTQNSDGSYETRVYTDYTQTAAEGAGRVAGWGLGVLLELIFMSKLTVGGTLLVISMLCFAGGATGWGFFLLLVGGAIVLWWWHLHDSDRQAMERAAELERMEADFNLRKSKALAEAHSTPPTEPVVTLGEGERELARFWTRDGGKGVVTTRRLIIDMPSGSMTVVSISEIKGVNRSDEGEYSATVHLPTGVGGTVHKIPFSSLAEAQRVQNELRTAVLNAT